MLGGSHNPSNFPYWIPGEAEGDAFPGSPGGQVFAFQAAAALNVGDAVYISAQGATALPIPITAGYPTAGWFPPQVNKSATLSNYTASGIGVVVGPANWYKSVVQGPNIVTAPTVAASGVGKNVIVMTSGFCWALVDGAVTIGLKLTASASTAGTLSSTGAVAGNILGYAANSTSGAGVTLVFLQRS